MTERQGARRTIVVSVEVDVDAFEDMSGLTPDGLAQRVCEMVRRERVELAAEMKIAALKLMGFYCFASCGSPLESGP